MMPSLFPDGKFLGKEAYAALLAQQNLTIPDFEADLKRQMLITRLRDIALEGTVVTQPEIEAEYRKKNEQVKIEYVKIASDKYKSEVQVTPEDLQSYFKANAAQYTIPEKRNLAILIADQNKLQQTVNPTDDQLRVAYNQDQAQFRIPETREGASHPAEDPGQAGLRGSQDQGPGRRHPEAGQGGRQFRGAG